MAFQIRVSPDALRQSAEEILAVLNESEDFEQQINMASTQLEEAWTGPAGTNAVNLLRRLGEPLVRGKEALNEGANMLRAIAQRFEEIDNGEGPFLVAKIDPRIFIMLGPDGKSPFGRDLIANFKLSSGVIQVVPEQVRAASERCRALSERAKDLSAQVERISVNLQNDWEGNAYNRFSNDFSECKKFYIHFSEALDEFAAKIRFAADRYEEIDNMLG